MPEGRIPINMGDFPLNLPELDDSLVYRGELKRVIVNPTTAKNGFTFCKVQFELTAPEEAAGRYIGQNYLPLPVALSQTMSKAEYIQARNRGVPFKRFYEAFHLRGNPPEVDLSDPKTIEEFQEWISQSYGNNGQFTIVNGEYNGRPTVSVQDYIS